MNDAQILNILRQINMALMRMEKLMVEIKKEGLKVKTQESHA